MNNLKAERTLTAENGWREIDSVPMDGTTVDLWCRRSWMPPVTHERSVDMYWCTVHECWRQRGHEHYVDHVWTPSKAPNSRHLIPELWRDRGLPGESLSTQQPMGEVVAWQHKFVRSDGFVDTEVNETERHPFGIAGRDYDGSAIITSVPLYALHPNQESGE